MKGVARCVLVWWCVACVVEAASSVNTTVKITNGWITGIYDSKTQRKLYYGIPYALPPTGTNRWKRPQPMSNWDYVRNATSYGSSCAQMNTAVPPQPVGNEDCLFLNVYAPATWEYGDPPLPVMIWIHGGSFWQGSGNINPTLLQISNEIIVVSMNYRLGIFGYLNIPELVAETPDKNAGFFGVQDQRAAFQWVKDNIRIFGGDPTKVTIAGQSAGAMSVCIHIAAPRSGNLFTQALMESGSCKVLLTQESATSTSLTAANVTGCPGSTVLNCLRGKSVEVLLGAMNGPLYPSYNAYEIQDQPANLVKQGKYNKVALLAGTNHDEQSFQSCYNWPGITIDEYNATVNRIIPTPAVRLAVYRMYPGQYFSPPINGITALWTDTRFRAPTLDLFVGLSSNKDQTLPLFLYSFDHVRSNQGNPCFGVQHSDELNFVFPGGSNPKFYQWWTAGERIMSNTFREWWTSFVVKGVPYSNTSGVTWSPYNDKEKNYMSIQCNANVSQSAMKYNFLVPYYDFWQSPVNYTGPVPSPGVAFTTYIPTPATSSATSAGATLANSGVTSSKTSSSGTTSAGASSSGTPTSGVSSLNTGSTTSSSPTATSSSPATSATSSGPTGTSTTVAYDNGAHACTLSLVAALFFTIAHFI